MPASRVLLGSSSITMMRPSTALLARTQGVARVPQLPMTRSLSQTVPLALKESQSSDPNTAEYDKHKQDSLSKQKQGKGHWKPELASVSEESVKADRMTPGEAGEEAMKRLQERTKQHAEELSKHGTSMRDGL